MSVGYQAVGWNRQKKIYDLVLGSGVVLYLAAFLGVGAIVRPTATVETMLLRALGTGALVLLHVVLSIGPLCRLDRRFLPLLYNRRHLGVSTFLLGAAHGGFAIVHFHALGDVHPLVSVLVSNPRYESLSQFPFQVLGLIALILLFFMAATSHDFWLANLTAPVWKSLHMLVYVAYGLIVMHVVLGVLQAETNPWLAITLGLGMVWIVGLHLISAWRERRLDVDVAAAEADATGRADAGRLEEGRESAGFVEVCGLDDIVDDRACVVSLGGERVAVFKYHGKVSAVSNVCQHQNGPLGEGKIVDGCITCPWHGFQYLPETGASPPPFTEKIPTFDVRVTTAGRVMVHPRPHPPGTRVAPASFEVRATGAEASRAAAAPSPPSSAGPPGPEENHG